MVAVLIFLLSLTFGLITAGIAKWKGRDPWQWLLYGAVLCIVAIPVLISKPRRESENSRSPWILFLAAVIVITLAAVLQVYQWQNATTTL